MKQINVAVQPDHLQRMSTVRKPILALAELIWNGLDADAGEVEVIFNESFLGAPTIEVKDNGHGLTFAEADVCFGFLGGSWKKTSLRSREKKRMLHGQEGKGRFRAMSLGAELEWNTRFRANGNVMGYRIIGRTDAWGKFIADDVPSITDQKPGTDVIVKDLAKHFRSLQGDAAQQQVAQIFALYLRQYPDVKILFDRVKVEPSLVEKRLEEIPLPEVKRPDGRVVDASITVIEWRVPAERALFLCDRNGFTLHELQAGIQAPGHNFSAYLRSDLIRELDDDGTLTLGDLNPALQGLLESTRDALKTYFRKRDSEQAADLVADWKRKNTYPYDGEPANAIETSERQVFDIIALNVNEYLPNFLNQDEKSQRFAFRLIRQALERNPEDLQTVIEEVLNLPKDRVSELASLVRATSLSAIISAAAMVTDRLRMLKGLEVLIFEEQSNKELLERSQLHRLLAENTWVFGEEYNLSIDDESLSSVLKAHLHLLRDPTKKLKPAVKLVDGRDGIVDLMLSKMIPQPDSKDRQHLVIELKRPKVPVNAKVAKQIQDYAAACAADKRFLDTRTRWIFWAVSTEIDDSVRRLANQRGRPAGLYDDSDENFSVWVKSWGQIIEECRSRLSLFQKRLGYTPDHEAAIKMLRKLHGKYLPPVFQATNP